LQAGWDAGGARVAVLAHRLDDDDDARKPHRRADGQGGPPACHGQCIDFSHQHKHTPGSEHKAHADGHTTTIPARQGPEREQGGGKGDGQCHQSHRPPTEVLYPLPRVAGNNAEKHNGQD
jgi:hypothetical protein